MANYKCFANYHMTPEEFGFWEVCRSLSHKFKGKLIFDGRNIADCFGDTGKGVAYRLAKKLCVKGWFVCLKKSKKNGRPNGTNTPTEYRVLSHEEWVKEHSKKHCKSPVPESGQAHTCGETSPVPESRMACTGIENEPVPDSGHSTEYTSILNKQLTDEFRDIPKETLLQALSEMAGQDARSAEAVQPVPESGQAEARRAQFEFMRTHGGSDSVWRALKAEFEPNVV